MTEQKAIEFLKMYLDEELYLKKCVEAHSMAIQALEKQSMVNEILNELKQYRAIGTVEELNKYLMAKTKLEELSGHTVDVTKLIYHFCETIFEGEKHEGFCILTNEDAKAWKSCRL